MSDDRLGSGSLGLRYRFGRDCSTGEAATSATTVNEVGMVAAFAYSTIDVDITVLAVFDDGHVVGAIILTAHPVRSIRSASVRMIARYVTMSLENANSSDRSIRI